MLNNEAEIIELKFRTADDSAVLLDTRAQNATDRILLMMSNGELSLRLHFASGAKHVSLWCYCIQLICMFLDIFLGISLE
jgi:hypothetical protein